LDLKTRIREISDFPQKGVLFRDITTLLADPEAFKYIVNEMTQFCADKQVTNLVAVESRGFIFAGAIADRLGVGFSLVRKVGKLPAETVQEAYDLEYGSAIIEMHRDAVTSDDRVVIIDDLLATGGTARATASLVERLGAKVVGLAFVIELTELNGRARLDGYDILSLVTYD
jgi:adenine phosphoribosyltransferase